MDEIASVLGAVPGTGGATDLPGVLNQQDFLNIMIAELTNQDPLEPLDNSQFLEQLTQIQTLQATTRLTEGIEGLLTAQRITSASEMIGKSIVALGPSGESVEGVVDRVVIEDGRVLLGVGNDLVSIDQVRELAASADDSE